MDGHAATVPIATWIDVGGFELAWALRYDTLAAVMVGDGHASSRP